MNYEVCEAVRVSFAKFRETGVKFAKLDKWSYNNEEWEVTATIFAKL